VGSFGRLGVTSATTYATLAYSYRGVLSGWDFILEKGSYSTDPGQMFRFSPSEGLVFSVPQYGEGVLVGDDASGSVDENGNRISANFKVLGGDLYLKVASVEDKRLQYTGTANFYSRETYEFKPFTQVTMSYGVGTSPGAAPSTGTHLYLVSRAVDKQLRVDFSARTVTGAITDFSSPTVPWKLDQVALSDDRTRFKGKIVHPATGIAGTIEGRFNGPTGEELMMVVTFDREEWTSQIHGIRVP